MGLFQRCRRPRFPLFFAPQDDYERGPLHGDAAREADLLDGPSQSYALPSRWGALPQKQESDGFSQAAEVRRDGLARQFAGPEPDRESLVDPEGQAEEEGQHLVAAPAHQGHQGALGQAAQGSHGETCALHACPYQNVPGKRWPDDQVLVKNVIFFM